MNAEKYTEKPVRMQTVVSRPRDGAELSQSSQSADEHIRTGGGSEGSAGIGSAGTGSAGVGPAAYGAEGEARMSMPTGVKQARSDTDPHAKKANINTKDTEDTAMTLVLAIDVSDHLEDLTAIQRPCD